MENLTREARSARISQLTQELLVLREQEAAEFSVDEKAVVEECRALKRAHKDMEATKLYRSKMGCGLREAHDAVQSMST